MDLNITSTHATNSGGDGKTLRELLKETAVKAVDEMIRRVEAVRKPAVIVAINKPDTTGYFVQLTAGPFQTEEEAVGVFTDLSNHHQEIIRETEAIQKMHDNLQALDQDTTEH